MVLCLAVYQEAFVIVYPRQLCPSRQGNSKDNSDALYSWPAMNVPVLETAEQYNLHNGGVYWLIH